jgi:hypothetical protein
MQTPLAGSIPSQDGQIAERQTKGTRYNHDSVWLILLGSCMSLAMWISQLSFLSSLLASLALANSGDCLCRWCNACDRDYEFHWCPFQWWISWLRLNACDRVTWDQWCCSSVCSVVVMTLLGKCGLALTEQVLQLLLRDHTRCGWTL